MQSTPTLVGLAVVNDQHGFIRVPFQCNRAVLPDLRVTDSSEAMLSGRKPPLRLMMRAIFKETLQPVPHVRHAISEGFVVAVRILPHCDVYQVQPEWDSFALDTYRGLHPESISLLL